MLGVIGIHCTAAFVSADMDRSTVSWWYGSFLQHIVRIGLPLFFLLSGALALDKDYPSVLAYYKKRTVKILIPFLVYSWFYVILNYPFHEYGLLRLIPYYIKCIITGNVSYHLWFIYSILGLYLCTPFLSSMLHSISLKALTCLVVLMLAVQGLQIYPSMLGINVEIESFIFSGWVLYYILGYYLSRREILEKLPEKIFYLGFFIALGLTEYIWWWHPGYANGMYDFSYTMILMACTVFLWFEKHADLFCRLPEKLDGFVSFVSRYSFSIYLIHAMVLSELVGTRMGITIYWSNYIIASAVRIFLVFVLSLLFSIIVDQVLTKPLQKIAGKVL
jgi:surface polysaccharide O-acyltransferase-like enzyme